MKIGVFTVAVNPPSDETSPLTVSPFGSGAFWSWASAGRPVRPTMSKLAAATMETLLIIGALPRWTCELQIGGSGRSAVSAGLLSRASGARNPAGLRGGKQRLFANVKVRLTRGGR